MRRMEYCEKQRLGKIQPFHGTRINYFYLHFLSAFHSSALINFGLLKVQFQQPLFFFHQSGDPQLFLGGRNEIGARNRSRVQTT